MLNEDLHSQEHKNLEASFDVEKAVQEYKNNIEIYRSFEQVLKEYIKHLIEKEVKKEKLAQSAFEIRSRTKTIESFKGKINRDDKKLKYTDPLIDVTDLVGVKLMLTSLKDEEIVFNLLKKEFENEIDEKNSINKSEQLQQDRKFGYLGKHLVISFNEKMLSITSNEKFKKMNFDGLKAEIQVKTLLQHVWAEVEHKVRYKAGQQLAIDKQRYFDRLAALMEVADELFKGLIEESEKINKEEKETIEREQENNYVQEQKSTQEKNSVRLDSSSLLLYLKNEHVKQKFKALENKNLSIAYNEDPDYISAKFITLLERVGFTYTKKLNDLFEDGKLIEILHLYAKYMTEKSRHKSTLQKLSVLGILLYAKANEQQKKEIQTKKLIFEPTLKILDKLIQGDRDNDAL